MTALVDVAQELGTSMGYTPEGHCPIPIFDTDELATVEGLQALSDGACADAAALGGCCLACCRMAHALALHTHLPSVGIMARRFNTDWMRMKGHEAQGTGHACVHTPMTDHACMVACTHG